MEDQASYTLNVESFFYRSSEGQIEANIDKYFEHYKATMPHNLSELIFELS
jgi:hypothetical protein